MKSCEEECCPWLEHEEYEDEEFDDDDEELARCLEVDY